MPDSEKQEEAGLFPARDACCPPLPRSGGGGFPDSPPFENGLVT